MINWCLLGPVNWLMGPWTRARRAEARLRETEGAVITVRIRLNGDEVASYPITAYRLRSSGDWCDDTWAIGHGSNFIIETDIEVTA
jgi:hypothetical protein